MEFFFTILKFVSALVSGLGAIIAAIPDYRRSKASKKSKFNRLWHKLTAKQSGLYIAITGLLVAMLSQFGETYESSQQSKDAQEKFAEQMNIATNSLQSLQTQLDLSKTALEDLQDQNLQMRKQMAYMNHIAGEFDTLTVDVTCQLSSTNPIALILIKRVADVAQSIDSPLQSVEIGPAYTNSTSKNVLTATVTFPAVMDDHMPREDSSRPRLQETAVYSQNMVGYINATNYSVLTNQVNDSFNSFSEFGMGQVIPYEHIFSPDWFASISSNAPFMKLMDFIELPMLGIRLYSSRTMDLNRTSSLSESDADFVAPPPGVGTVQPTISYAPLSHSIILKWSIDYPNQLWQQNVRMGSVNDLDAATLCFYFANLPDYLVDDFKPISLELGFGGTDIKVNKFEVQSYEEISANYIKLAYCTNVLSQSTDTNGVTSWTASTCYNAADSKVAMSLTTNGYVTAHSSITAHPITTMDEMSANYPGFVTWQTNRVVVLKTVLPPPNYDPIEVPNDDNTN